MLHVYKASAGSGKTYSLTFFYLRICFDHLEDPRYFQHILAMTFTNDATAEMKSRIIRELKYLARGDDKAEHRKKLKEECRLTDEEVQEGARSILRAMMQHYTRFSISTIDSFFQRVLKIFMRELNLEGGYEVELDTDKVLDAAMTSFLEDLYPDSPHLKWIEMILQQRMEEGKNANFHDELLKLGKILFQEDLEQKLSERNTEELQGIFRNLQERIYQFEGIVNDNIEKARSVLERYDLQYDDFKGGKTRSFTKKWFEKIPDLYNIEESDIDKLREAEDNIEEWYAKSTSAEVVGKIEAAFSSLNALLSGIIEFLDRYLREYLTLIEMRKNFPAFAFLTTLDTYIQDYCEREHKVLLSRTTFLLKKVIDYQIIPFFYERLGHQYHHILLDEFQDTSGTQWENLKVLVDHALSEQHMHSLIVGDVKQAIYRWRNGDWRTLQIELEKDYAYRELYKPVPLEFNWRSLENIISFNNKLFDFLPEAGMTYALNEWEEGTQADYQPGLIEDVFSAHSQKLMDDGSGKRKGGFIHLDAIASGYRMNDDQEELHWTLLKQHIKSAIDRGYELRDICILVRRAREGTEVAEKLFEWQQNEENGEKFFKCSSREVLQLSSSIVVQAIIAFFKLVRDRSDTVARAEWHQALESLEEEAPAYIDYAFLPDELSELLDACQTQSLWEISDQVIHHFGLGKHSKEIPFLQHLQDEILNFMQREGGHIGAFLEWWEEKGFESSVVMPEGQNAIRIITIHKSKGLEFPVVILPFANWAVSELSAAGNRDIWIWSKEVKVAGENFAVFPANFSKRLRKTDFTEAYNNELVQQVIDNLNLLYVATTRSERELYLLMPQLELPDSGKLKTVGDLILQRGKDHLDFSLQDEELQHYTFEWGEPTSVKADEIEADQLITLDVYRAARSIPPLSGRFVRTDLDQEEVEALSRGRALHWLFEHIEKEEDVTIAINQALMNGIIEEQKVEELEEQLKALFRHEIIGDLLREKADILHEREIMLNTGKLLRPDRVILSDGYTKVVDFKTGEHYAKNEHQLRGYMNALSDMDYKNVKGFLLYLDRAELMEIT